MNKPYETVIQVLHEPGEENKIAQVVGRSLEELGVQWEVVGTFDASAATDPHGNPVFSEDET